MIVFIPSIEFSFVPSPQSSAISLTSLSHHSSLSLQVTLDTLTKHLNKTPLDQLNLTTLIMPAGGFPAYPSRMFSSTLKHNQQSLTSKYTGFPNDMPPTLFHPASPKIKSAKSSASIMENDSSSIATTSTFSSKVGLIKDSVKSKFPISYKDYRARKDAAANSTVTSSEKESKSKPKPRPETKSRKLPDYKGEQISGSISMEEEC